MTAWLSQQDKDTIAGKIPVIPAVWLHNIEDPWVFRPQKETRAPQRGGTSLTELCSPPSCPADQRQAHLSLPEVRVCCSHSSAGTPLTNCSGVLLKLPCCQVQADNGPRMLLFPCIYAKPEWSKVTTSLPSVHWPWPRGCPQPSMYLLIANLYPAGFPRLGGCAHDQAKGTVGSVKNKGPRGRGTKGVLSAFWWWSQ